jgi:hypothetical protein
MTSIREEQLVERELTGETKLLGENVSQYHFFHQKFQNLDLESNPSPRGGKSAPDRLIYGTAWWSP